LLGGQYGFEQSNQHSPNRNKPYSKQYQAIDKPQMHYSDGQNIPIA
jgi:hypothetical protein